MIIITSDSPFIDHPWHIVDLAYHGPTAFGGGLGYAASLIIALDFIDRITLQRQLSNNPEYPWEYDH